MRGSISIVIYEFLLLKVLYEQSSMQQVSKYLCIIDNDIIHTYYHEMNYSPLLTHSNLLSWIELVHNV